MDGQRLAFGLLLLTVVGNPASASLLDSLIKPSEAPVDYCTKPKVVPRCGSMFNMEKCDEKGGMFDVVDGQHLNELDGSKVKSMIVAPNCEMTLCTSKDLDGTCHPFKSANYNIAYSIENLAAAENDQNIKTLANNVKSAKCICGVECPIVFDDPLKCAILYDGDMCRLKRWNFSLPISVTGGQEFSQNTAIGSLAIKAGCQLTLFVEPGINPNGENHAFDNGFTVKSANLKAYSISFNDPSDKFPNPADQTTIKNLASKVRSLKCECLGQSIGSNNEVST